MTHSLRVSDPDADRHALPAGFSLPELLIACTVLGIALAAALPRIDFVRPRADAAVSLVRGTLQQAQRAAVQRQNDVIVSFDATTNRIRIADDPGNDGTITGTDGVTWRALETSVSLQAPPTRIPGGAGSGAVSGPRLRTIDGLPSIIYHRAGSSSTDLEVYLLVRGRAGSTQRRAVTVTRGTGGTTVWSDASGAWRRNEL